MTEHQQHHPTFAPSSWGRIEACPGSPRLILKNGLARQDTGGDGAERGTRLHELALRDGEVDVDADLSLSVFDASAVHQARQWIADKRSQYESEGWKFGARHTEERLDIKSSTGELLSFGTADRFWVAEGDDSGRTIAILLDLKFHPTGSIPERATTLQLAAYAIGIFHEYDVEEVHAFAYAPHGPAEWSFVMPKSRLPLYLSLAEKLHAFTTGEHEPADLVPGAHCQYCPALLYCAQAQVNVRELGELGEKPTEAWPIQRIDGELRIVDDRRLAELWSQAKAAEAFLKAFKDEVLSALQVGGSEYLTLRKKGGARSFVCGAPMAEDLPEAIREHITDTDIEALLKLSVSDLEHRFRDNYAKGKVNFRGAKKEATELFRREMSGLVRQADPSYSVQFKRGKADAWKR